MSLITNTASWAWNTFTSAAFSETGRSIGKIGGGVLLFEAGRRIASRAWHHPAYHGAPWRKRATMLAGAGICVVGACLAISGIAELVLGRDKPPTPTPTFTCTPSSPLHPHEEEMRERFGESSLCFNATDPRDKVLYLTAKDNRFPSGGERSQDRTPPRFHNENLADLNEQFDIKYKAVGLEKQICQEIQEASRSNRLAGVIIHAHRSLPRYPDGLWLDANADGQFTEFDDFSPPCFQGSPQAKVVLYPESFHNMNFTRFFQHIADIFQRVTYAPNGPSRGLSILPHFEPRFDHTDPNYTSRFSPGAYIPIRERYPIPPQASELFAEALQYVLFASVMMMRDGGDMVAVEAARKLKKIIPWKSLYPIARLFCLLRGRPLG